MVVEYKAGRDNLATDALSRVQFSKSAKENSMSSAAISTIVTN